MISTLRQLEKAPVELGLLADFLSSKENCVKEYPFVL